MTPLLTELSPLRTALLAAVPLVYALAALAAELQPRAPHAGWRAARWAALLAGAAALLSLAGLLWQGPGVARGPALFGLPPLSDAAVYASLRSDALGGAMLLLVSFIGWVIVGYARTYLGGERGQPRFVRNLMLTLAAVSLLVLSNNLFMLGLGWVATSLALHGLLTFFERRPQALIAAHKKFLASRVADVCLFAGIALVGVTFGTLEIDQATAAAGALSSVPGAWQVAACLFAASALLKCAQLPVHGWLIQVMEAPTPVSALLHAGIVNLGGFLLIRLGTLVADVPVAQALLVVVGSVTAVVAALVMTTRISIKVALAWSTCAQMGFMMMQCGLGLHDLALLHLLAHSLYKAHAFLGAGGAVAENRLQQMTPAAPALSLGRWWLGAALGALLVGGAALAWGVRPAEAPALWLMAFVLALALAPLLAGPAAPAAGAWRWVRPLAAFVVALAYVGLHVGSSHWLGVQAVGVPPSWGLMAWVLGCFGLLFAVQGAVRAHPDGRLARSLYPWLCAGLYLDELFTRLTFRVWPARLPAKSSALPPFRLSPPPVSVPHADMAARATGVRP